MKKPLSIFILLALSSTVFGYPQVVLDSVVKDKSQLVSSWRMIDDATGAPWQNTVEEIVFEDCPEPDFICRDFTLITEVYVSPAPFYFIIATRTVDGKNVIRVDQKNIQLPQYVGRTYDGDTSGGVKTNVKRVCFEIESTLIKTTTILIDSLTGGAKVESVSERVRSNEVCS